MYAKLIDGKLKRLPRSGEINGKSVSNYDLLPESVLLAEGWLSYVENKPVCKETEMLEFVDYTQTKDGITANYKVMAIPEPELSIEERLEAVEQAVLTLIGGK